MPDFGIMRGFNEKLFGDKLVAGQLPTQLGLIGSQNVSPLLLDAFPNAAAAYSLRKLNTAYTGSAIRVRRTDLTESDIGFTSTGALDTTALIAFTGTGALDNGFITTWYDQSGNGRNATQTTALSQPQIVNAGSIYQLNSKPTIIAQPTQNWSFTAVSSNLYSLFITYYKTATGNQAIIGSGNNNYMWLDYELSQYVASGAMITISSVFNSNTSYTYNAIANSAVGAEIFRNNLSIGTIGTYTGNDITEFPYSIARTANLHLQEMIIYSSNQATNRSGIEGNINDFYSIY
jgi:hypothetical protein